MNKVAIEKSSDNLYNVTLPTGAHSSGLTKAQLIELLKQEEKNHQDVVTDLKARREKLEGSNA